MASKPLNPKNVPTTGNMTYAALTPISPAQLKLLHSLRMRVGDPHIWEDISRTVLGKDWDGEYHTLSQAAASWLIHNVQTGLVVVAERQGVEL
jgi:hypothetical protein